MFAAGAWPVLADAVETLRPWAMVLVGVVGVLGVRMFEDECRARRGRKDDNRLVAAVRVTVR